MLNLFRECTNAFKLAVGWGEAVLIVGHGFGGGDKIAFHSFGRAVEYLADGFPFVFRWRLRLRQSNAAQGQCCQQGCKDRFHVASK
jgi:hypothetical protein